MAYNDPGTNGQAVRDFFSGLSTKNFLTNSKGEYFPNISYLGNKLQNAFLQSGVNTGKTGFKSGLQSYTPNTSPVTGLNVKAPIVTSTTVAPVPPQVIKSPKNTKKESSYKNTSGTKPLEAAANPMAAAGATDFTVPAGLSSLGVSGQYTPTVSSSTQPKYNTSSLENWGTDMNTPIAPTYSLSSPNQNYGFTDRVSDSAKNLFNKSGGLGSYATVTGSDGQSVNISPEAYDAIMNPTIGSEGSQAVQATQGLYNPNVTNPSDYSFDTGLSSTAGMLPSLADLTGLYGTIMGYKYAGNEDDRRERMFNTQMSEINRQKQRDVDWQNNINKSGLGTYSAGLGSN